jgi:O-antigen ligase
MDREVVDKWLERGILAVVTATLVWGPVAMGGVRPQEYVWLQGLVAVGIVLWLVRLWLGDGIRLQWSPVSWFVLAFMGYAAVWYGRADVEYVARLECLRVLLYGWLFFLIVNNLHRQEAVQWLLGAALATGTVISLYALYQFFSGANQVFEFARPAAYRGRGSGTFICPNHLAGYVEMLLPVALAILVLSRRKAVARIFSAYAALMLLAGLGVSLSRGGYLAGGAALAGFVAVLVSYRGYRRPVLIGVAVLAVLTITFALKTDQMQKRFRRMLVPGQIDNIMGRTDLWGAAVRVWTSSPWVGVGPAHFDLRFPAHRPESLQTRPYWVHNDYLNLLADWGVVGGVLAGGALASLVWGGLRTWRFVRREGDGITTKPSDRAAFVLGSGLGLTAIALHSLVDFNLQIPANAMLATTLAAVLSSHLRFTTNRYWFNPRLVGRIAITVAGAVTVVWFAREGFRRGQEAAWLARAERATTFTDQVAALEQAARVEPGNADLATRLGEAFRQKSWDGGPDWEGYARTALQWFERAMALNRWDTYPILHGAMTLDWLGRHEEAGRWFERVGQMDPNNHYVALLRGWHAMQVSQWVDAERWLNRSIAIKPYSNWLAHNYLGVVQQRLAEGSASPGKLPP